MFDLDYRNPTNWQELQTAVSEGWKRPHATVVEINVPSTEGTHTLQSLLASVSQA